MQIMTSGIIHVTGLQMTFAVFSGTAACEPALTVAPVCPTTKYMHIQTVVSSHQSLNCSKSNEMMNYSFCQLQHKILYILYKAGVEVAVSTTASE
jgi:hypothetical protein